MSNSNSGVIFLISTLLVGITGAVAVNNSVRQSERVAREKKELVLKKELFTENLLEGKTLEDAIKALKGADYKSVHIKTAAKLLEEVVHNETRSNSSKAQIFSMLLDFLKDSNDVDYSCYIKPLLINEKYLLRNEYREALLSLSPEEFDKASTLLQEKGIIDFDLKDDLHQSYRTRHAEYQKPAAEKAPSAYVPIPQGEKPWAGGVTTRKPIEQLVAECLQRQSGEPQRSGFSRAA